MDRNYIEQTIDDINIVIDKLSGLQTSLDAKGRPMSKDERELLKIVFMTENMPKIINKIKTAFYVEDHDMASEACYDYKCLMETVTGIKVD